MLQLGGRKLLADRSVAPLLLQPVRIPLWTWRALQARASARKTRLVATLSAERPSRDPSRDPPHLPTRCKRSSARLSRHQAPTRPSVALALGSRTGTCARPRSQASPTRVPTPAHPLLRIGHHRSAAASRAGKASGRARQHGQEARPGRAARAAGPTRHSGGGAEKVPKCCLVLGFSSGAAIFGALPIVPDPGGVVQGCRVRRCPCAPSPAAP